MALAFHTRKSADRCPSSDLRVTFRAEPVWDAADESRFGQEGWMDRFLAPVVSSRSLASMPDRCWRRSKRRRLKLLHRLRFSRHVCPTVGSRVSSLSSINFNRRLCLQLLCITVDCCIDIRYHRTHRQYIAIAHAVISSTTTSASATVSALTHPPPPTPPHLTLPSARRRQTFMVFRRRAGPFRAPGVTCTGLPRHSRRASAEPGVCRADACVGVSACRVYCPFMFVCVCVCRWTLWFRTNPAGTRQNPTAVHIF